MWFALFACTPRSGVPPEPLAETPQNKAGIPTLLLAQAQFVDLNPGPARLEILQHTGTGWTSTVLEDPTSNVFHLAVPWRGGLLTASGSKAALKHWRRVGEEWQPTTLVAREFGGKFSRYKDVEFADMDGDGREEIVAGTHDRGIVTVGTETAEGGWSFEEFDARDDTFVHEVEVGDVDGDGVLEIYAARSARNLASGMSVGGEIRRYEGSESNTVAEWLETHAKEILVADLDGNGVDELYAARESVRRRTEAGRVEPIEPVQILRIDTGAVIARLPNETSVRFLVPADLDRDGTLDVVIAGRDTGLWWLRGTGGGSFADLALIDASSGSFEHAIGVGDLDRDGRPELYVANENRAYGRALRRYSWTGETLGPGSPPGTFTRQDIGPIPEGRITWSVVPTFLDEAVSPPRQ